MATPWSEGEKAIVTAHPDMASSELSRLFFRGKRSKNAIDNLRLRMKGYRHPSSLPGMRRTSSAAATLAHQVGRRTLLAKTCLDCLRLVDGDCFSQYKGGLKKSYCNECARERINIALIRANQHRSQGETLPLAHKSGDEWTAEEDEFLFATVETLTRVEQAKALGRTYGAVLRRASVVRALKREYPEPAMATCSWKIEL